MNTDLFLRSDELHANLAELAAACPFHQSNPEDCPLFPLRKMEATRRLQWLKALSEAELRYLANYHHVCLRIKLEPQAAESDCATSGE